MESENGTVSFKSRDGLVLSFDKERAYYSKLLRTMHTTKVPLTTENGAILLQCSDEELSCVHTYLQTGEIERCFSFELFDYFQIPLPEFYDQYKLEYMKIKLADDLARTVNKEKPYCKKHRLRDVIASVPDYLPIDTDNIVHSKNRYWTIRLKKLTKNIKLLLNGIDIAQYNGKIVLAGGSLNSIILGKEVNDLDMFFVGVTPGEAMSIIESFISSPHFPKQDTLMHLSESCFTVRNVSTLQFVFRIYKNIDEILLGFDVDACSIVYDGNEIYLSDRALYALRNHVNNVDFTRLSPTYEIRLLKYAQRGFDVFAPNVVKSEINYKKIETIKYRRAYVNPKSGCVNLWDGPQRRGVVWTEHRSEERQFLDEEIANNHTEKLCNRFMYTGIHDDLDDLEIQIPQFRGGLKLYGLDVLLFGMIRDLETISGSDYTKYGNNFHAKMGDKNFGTSIRIQDGCWMSWIRKEGETFSFNDESFKETTQRYSLEIKWITENSGKQISSTFHKILLNDPGDWYEGIFYGTRRTSNNEEITIKL